MSRAGRRAADDLGRTLPRFGSQEEAEKALFDQRDLLLGRLRTAAAASPSFQCDLTPESLKTLERWYFEVRERGTFARYGLSPETFGRCIAMYLGEVIVKNHAAFRWVVREFPFVPGTYGRPLALLGATAESGRSAKSRGGVVLVLARLPGQ